MKNKKTILMLSLVSVMTVALLSKIGIASAASNGSIDIKSHGIFKYDANGDGTVDEGDIVLDSTDIEALSQKIAEVDSNATSAIIAETSSNRDAFNTAMTQEKEARTSADSDLSNRITSVNSSIPIFNLVSDDGKYILEITDPNN